MLNALKLFVFLLLGAGWLGTSAKPTFACGGLDDACTIPTGAYHVAFPDEMTDGSAKRPALLFFHGAGQSGAQVLNNNAAMVKSFTDRGYVVLLPNGLKRPDSRFGPGWSFLPQRPAQRDEMAFAKALIADASDKHGVDADAILMSGYSIGGSLTWYLACQDRTIAAAYAPVAGGFWLPIPETCDGPIKLLHTHGWQDQTVPLEGRPLRSGAIYQGDIFAGLAIWRQINSCDLLRPDSFLIEETVWRRKWEKCGDGTALEFALHSGGHNIPAFWAEMAINWFDAIRLAR